MDDIDDLPCSQTLKGVDPNDVDSPHPYLGRRNDYPALSQYWAKRSRHYEAEVERLREDFRTLYAYMKAIEGEGPVRYIEALDICRRNGGW